MGIRRYAHLDPVRPIDLLLLIPPSMRSVAGWCHPYNSGSLSCSAAPSSSSARLLRCLAAPRDCPTLDFALLDACSCQNLHICPPCTSREDLACSCIERNRRRRRHMRGALRPHRDLAINDVRSPMETVSEAGELLPVVVRTQPIKTTTPALTIARTMIAESEILPIVDVFLVADACAWLCYFRGRSRRW
jgi:hypothetical protein